MSTSLRAPRARLRLPPSVPPAPFALCAACLYLRRVEFEAYTFSLESHARWAAIATQLEGRERRVSGARLGCVLAAGAVFWIGYDTGWWSPALALVFVVGFAALVVYHDRLIRRRKRAQRAAAYHEGSLARIEGRWAGSGAEGEDYRDPTHPYAEDLDLFGRGSVFELLSRARTRSGERQLAAWLLGPSASDALRERQEAVRELADQIQLREDMAVIGEDLRVGLEPEALASWATSPPELASTSGRWLALGLVVATAATALGWALGWTSPLPFVIAVAAEALLAWLHRAAVHRILASVHRPTRDLQLLAEALARVEAHEFHCPRLRVLQGKLAATGASAAQCIDTLRRRVDILDTRKNELFAPLAALMLWGTQCAFAIEIWRRQHGSHIPGWLDAIGEMEALLSLAAYAHVHPDYVFPDITPSGPRFEAEQLGHPLLPRDGCIVNDVGLDRSVRVLLVSGSNMSGKSTLLRAVGLAAVLAQAGAPVRARRVTMSPLAIGASLRIVDSLQTGTSHFYAEIRRLRQIVDLTNGERSLLFLLDEILHGTNSHDRRIGAAAVVRELVRRGAIGLVTTHDLALAAIADEREAAARNVHFEDQIVDGVLTFDYTMRPGVVQRSNALELMRSVGLEV